jgi:nucleoside-diphosphate-sugar epimerase
MAANFIGLNNLLSLAAKKNAKRVLYLSSSEVYGQKDSMDPYFENDYGFLDILNQRASYPSSKRAAETLCVAYSMEYNLDTVIVRPGHIYGPAVIPSDNRATAQFTRNAVNREDIVMKSAGSQLRSYCYSLDCASAILAVLLNGERENAYNISNPDSIITISAIAKAIANAAGRKLTFENPADAEAKGYNLMSNSSLDSKKLEGLGWYAVFSPEEGARRCVEFYSE